ncbi:hypothetical protein FACS189490_07700 [Clostridia bacterium]|nr:hypothetical protein FACS189490_07700 [Clostridia bacterium]
MKKVKITGKWVVLTFYTVMAFVFLFVFFGKNDDVRDMAFYINIMESPTFAKEGFDVSAVTEFPDAESGVWKQYADNVPRRIVNSGLSGLPKRAFLSPVPAKDAAFTITAMLNVSPENISFLKRNPTFIPGLFIGYIGENWEIYLNGNLIKSELHLDDNGNIKSGRMIRDVYFPIRASLFKEGENLLCFRIVGDPTYKATGMYYTSPYYVGDYNVMNKQNNYMIPFAMCGIYFLLAVYHAMLFLGTRTEKYHINYSLLTFVLGIYTLVRNPNIYSVFPNSDIVARIEFSSLIFLFAVIDSFIYLSRERKFQLPTKIFGIFCTVCAVSVLFVPSMQYSNDVLLIWEIVLIPYSVFAISYGAVYGFIQDTRALWKNEWAGFSRKERNFKYLLAMGDTTPGNMLIGFIFLIITAIGGTLVGLLFQKEPIPITTSFFILVIGVAFSLSNKLSSLYAAAELSKGKLERAKNRLERAKAALENVNENLEATVAERTKELARQTAIAVTANESKSKFLATMSHEIRTPMNAIIGVSQIQLMDKTLPEKAADGFLRIQTSGNSLLGIINDILDFSKIESGKLDITEVAYDLPSLINDAVQLNIIRIASKPIEFKLEVDPQTFANLYGDSLRIKQILNNILSNAFKYTHEGYVTMSVTSKRVSERVFLAFRVSDTGRGMSEENVKKLFDEYSRFDESSNRAIEGTGLGMSITSRLVEMMNGTIEVKSELGKGTDFTVTIEQTCTDDTIIGTELANRLNKFEFAANKAQKAANVVYTNMSYGRVLIVDDVETNLFVAQGIMSPYGLNIETAHSGFEALAKVKSGAVYDVIFMDHMMPKMDGIETTARIRWLGYTLPIVALTANAIAGNDKMFKSSGFDDFISKPIDLRRLDAVLKVFVRDRHKDEAEIDTPFYEPPKQKDYNEQLMKIFKNDAKNAAVTLRETAESGDLFLFATTAHAMKSACANANEKEMSELAKELELAAKNGDGEFVRANAPALIEKLIAAVGEETAEIAGNTIEINDTLSENLKLAKKHAEEYDDAAANAVIAELREADQPPETAAFLEKIESLLMFSEFDEVCELIDNLLGQ